MPSCSKALALSALLLGAALAADPSCAASGCTTAEDDAAALLQQKGGAGATLKAAQGPEPSDVACPGSTDRCQGNQCCPGVELTGNKTFPCPSAEEGWNECAGDGYDMEAVHAAIEAAAPAVLESVDPPATCAFTSGDCGNTASAGACELCWGRLAPCHAVGPPSDPPNCDYLSCAQCVFCRSYCKFDADNSSQVDCKEGIGGYKSFCEENLADCLGCVWPYHSTA